MTWGNDCSWLGFMIWLKGKIRARATLGKRVFLTVVLRFGFRGLGFGTVFGESRVWKHVSGCDV